MPPCASVRETLEPIDEGAKLDACSARSERFDPERDLNRVLAIAELHWQVEFSSIAADSRDAEQSTSIACGVSKATSRRVEEDSVSWLKCLGLVLPSSAHRGTLLGDDPGKRLAVRDRQEVVSQRPAFPR
jgi:hypothetical protein